MKVVGIGTIGLMLSYTNLYLYLQRSVALMDDGLLALHRDAFVPPLIFFFFPFRGFVRVAIVIIYMLFRMLPMHVGYIDSMLTRRRVNARTNVLSVCICIMLSSYFRIHDASRSFYLDFVYTWSFLFFYKWNDFNWNLRFVIFDSRRKDLLGIFLKPCLNSLQGCHFKGKDRKREREKKRKG